MQVGRAMGEILYELSVSLYLKECSSRSEAEGEIMTTEMTFQL